MRIVLAILAVPSLLLSIGCTGTPPRTGSDSPLVRTISIDFGNVHLVSGDFGAFLVDAGTERGAPKLAERIRALGTDPATLRAVILTHGHADHAGGAHYFRNRFGVPVVVGAADVPMLAEGRNDRLCPTGFMARRLRASAQSATYPPTVADHAIGARTPLSSLPGLEGLDGLIVPVGTHTPGSIAIILGDKAFVGDLFRGRIMGSGATRHFFMCDPAANERAVATLVADEARAVRIFFTGHFGPAGRKAVESMLETSARAERVDGPGRGGSPDLMKVTTPR